MNKLLVLLLSAAVITIASAHMTMICSSTDPARAGEIDFYFGTYHRKSERVAGSVMISQPNVAGGASLESAFSPSRQYAISPTYTIKDLAGVKDTIVKSGALTNSKALVTCYVENAASGALKAPKDGQWIVPSNSKDSLKCQGGSYTRLVSWAKVSIKGAKSGDWRLAVKNTNDVYNPGAKQCSLSKNNPKWIAGMTVSDGGAHCKGTPPVGSGFDMSSIKKCSTLSGATCNFQCKDDKHAKSGTIECKKGKWAVSAKCTGASKCATEAANHIADIQTQINTCQATINGLTNGAHCPKEGQAIVDSAKASAKMANTNAKNAASALVTAEKTPVQISAIRLDKIDESDCTKLFSTIKVNSNYNSAYSALKSATTANGQAIAAKTVADKALTDALSAQAKAIMKCKCAATRGMESAYNKCTQTKDTQAMMWRKAHHLECVQNGTLTLTASHTTTGQCVLPPVPTVHKKKMAYPVTENECKKVGVEEDEAMDAAFEASVEEMDLEQVTSMPGWHHMDDGSMMKDSEM